MIGQIISHYYILEMLGRGGMGVVYKARDMRLGRLVALKFLSEELASDQLALEQFRQEARTASSLNCPAICTVHDIDEYREQPFIVMEFLEGRSLRQHLRRCRPTIEETLALGIQIAQALTRIHAKGIVHRDINPANLFITDEGQIKLLDFGIAKVSPAAGPVGWLPDAVTTSRSTLTGTVRYMSPEQVLGWDVDARSDIFSVGIVLYEMLTQEFPFAGETLADTLAQIIDAEPKALRALNPNVPSAIESIVNNCLKKAPEQRYQTAAELRDDLLRECTVSGKQITHLYELVVPACTTKQKPGDESVTSVTVPAFSRNRKVRRPDDESPVKNPLEL